MTAEWIRTAPDTPVDVIVEADMAALPPFARRTLLGEQVRWPACNTGAIISA